MNRRFPEPTHLKAFKWRGFFLFLLSLIMLASLLGIVYVQHEIRHTESSYHAVMQQTLVAKEEWGRLMLEKEHLTAPAMVEKIAIEQLNMTIDNEHFETVYLEPVQLEMVTEAMPEEISKQ